jgi:CspA family cold shock protein
LLINTILCKFKCMKRGVVKFINASTKFGFVIDDEDKKEYYVHIKDVSGNLIPGDAVIFELVSSNRGQRAVKVSKA